MDWLLFILIALGVFGILSLIWMGGNTSWKPWYGKYLEHPLIEWKMEQRSPTSDRWDWQVAFNGKLTEDGYSYGKLSAKTDLLTAARHAVLQASGEVRRMGKALPCAVCSTPRQIGEQTCGTEHKRLLQQIQQDNPELKGTL